jgi:hypothetical protein
MSALGRLRPIRITKWPVVAYSSHCQTRREVLYQINLATVLGSRVAPHCSTAKTVVEPDLGPEK